MDSLNSFTDKIDVLVLCGGSKDDLPEQGPALAKLFNTVDSFDTHARIPEYFEAVNKAAVANKNRTDFHRLGPWHVLLTACTVRRFCP